jgi:hypothetical protein
MPTLQILTALALFTILNSAALAFDPKPGRYVGALKVTTSFPNTDVRRSVVQKATGRLDVTGKMVIALPNTFDGIEEVGQQAAYLKFISEVPGNNACFVRILKDNFIQPSVLVKIKGETFSVNRTVSLAGPDAEGFNTNFSVTMELRMTRVGK